MGTTPAYKHKLRAVFRAASFLALIALFTAINFMQDDQNPSRRLEAADGSNMKGIFQIKADPMWLLAPYIFGVLYMFLALAIVCDEYFVPALEVMSDDNHLNISPDISGATLMAAGGSAPELFTSFIGTFQESEVGFGTIVGSAVFNVLFVIGMCSMLSKEVLTLTWWPLFRDSSYYAVGLLTLAVFVGVVTPGTIVWWEALVLFLMYIGYIVVMGLNETLYKMITGKDLYPKEVEEQPESMKTQSLLSFRRPTTFRAGLLTLIRTPDVWIDKARISFVSKVSGNVDDVFDYVDKDGDGEISREEIKAFFINLGEGNNDVTDEEVDMILKDIDLNGNGLVCKKEFKIWYIKSEEHIKKQIKKVFDTYDQDNSGTIHRNEMMAMLKEIEPDEPHAEYEYAVEQCFNEKTELSFDEFTAWYLNSTWFKKHERTVEEEEAKTIMENLLPPKDATLFGLLKYIFLLPIVATLTLTVPDSRRPGMSKGPWCYISFILAICWIGIYSYFMVGWAETIGTTLGIDSFIMGLTFLAAGTSVPDLLSSVIVARMGEGDMAVSSSIGSNIFDILVGLPIPWLAFSLFPTTPKSVTIGAEGVWVSIIILLGMVVSIIVAIHLSGWKLTKGLGFVMFFLYFLFLLQAILRYKFGW